MMIIITTLACLRHPNDCCQQQHQHHPYLSPLAIVIWKKNHYGKHLSSTYLVIRLLGAILHLPLDIMNPFKDLMPSDAHPKMFVVLNHH